MADVPVIDGYDPFDKTDRVDLTEADITGLEDEVGKYIDKTTYDPLWNNKNNYELFESLTKIRFKPEGLERLINEVPLGSLEDRRGEYYKGLTNEQKYDIGKKLLTYVILKHSQTKTTDNPLAKELGYEDTPLAVPDATPILPNQEQ